VKIFVAALGTETNTFSPISTTLADFAECFLVRPGEYPAQPHMVAAPRMAALRGGWTVVEGSGAFAAPSGVTTRAAYESLRDEILGQLRAALPVDVVAFGLHGAMIADGHDDCEGDLLARARALVGPDVKLGALLDPHCHLTQAMLDAADILVCYKESPHVDFAERADDLLSLLAAQHAGRIKPVMSVFDCRLLQWMPTVHAPMRTIVDRLIAREREPGVLSLSIVHGYPLGDVPDCGAKVLAITDGQPERGRAIAEAIGRELIAHRDELNPPSLTMDAALDQALALRPGPVVIADRADNAGGGAPSDSTHFIHLLRRRKITRAALGPLWDPIAVRFCHAAGLGAVRNFRIGGKVGAASGPPVDAEMTITHLARDSHQTFGAMQDRLGDVATVSFDGIDVVLTATRTQAFGADLFTAHGVDLAARDIVIVKSYTHFEAAFRPLAKAVLYTGGPGPLELDTRRLKLTRVRRPIWPLDAQPV
jgi:microcystin degradation protein MlrC